ncbi:Man1-Src1p-carboxy-terminal domain protein [Trifolium repens]|nr:Man1-Src1p-carboxy-terminal domain protein [Trifolium repens]
MLNCCALELDQFGFMMMICGIILSMWEMSKRVCEILEENALTSKSVNGECEPWVVASRLRDHLLLPRERKDPLLWKKVILKLFWNLQLDYPLLL